MQMHEVKTKFVLFLSSAKPNVINIMFVYTHAMNYVSNS
jgi:hypothetical protein